MDKNMLALYIKHQSGGNIVVEGYEEQSDPDFDENYIITKYQITDDAHPYITNTFIILYSVYKEWEREYLRKVKLDRLMKKMKNEN